MSNTIKQLERQNLRRLRAEHMTVAVLSEIDKRVYIDDDQYRAIQNAMEDVFAAKGIDFITDEIRAAAGLPPRGPDGWTLEEIVELERAHLEALRRPLEPLVVWSDKLREKSDD